MLKKSALTFALAASSAFGLSGCEEQQPSNVNAGVEKDTPSVTYDLAHLETIPASYFTAMDGSGLYGTSFSTTVPIQNVAGCFRAASALAQDRAYSDNSGICWGENGQVVAKTRARSGAVSITSLTPQPK